MKIFLEVDLTKGNGAVRWEGVTSRRVRRLFGSVVAVLGAVALLTLHRF